MNQRIASALVITGLVLVGCRSSGDDQTGGPVVRFRGAPPVDLGAGESAQATLELDIAEGHHIQANPAARESLIPATVELAGTPSIIVGPPVYPPGHIFKLEGSDWDLSTYDGRLQITVPLRADASAGPGEHALEGWFSYQACNRRSCLRPDRVPIALTVRVTP